MANLTTARSENAPRRQGKPFERSPAQNAKASTGTQADIAPWRCRLFGTLRRSVRELSQLRRRECLRELDPVRASQRGIEDEGVGASSGSMNDLQRRHVSKEFHRTRLDVDDQVCIALQGVRECIARSLVSGEAYLVDPSRLRGAPVQSELARGLRCDCERSASHDPALRFAENVRLQQQRVDRQPWLPRLNHECACGWRDAETVRFQRPDHICVGHRRSVAERRVGTQFDAHLLVRNSFETRGEDGLQLSVRVDGDKLVIDPRLGDRCKRGFAACGGEFTERPPQGNRDNDGRYRRRRASDKRGEQQRTHLLFFAALLRGVNDAPLGATPPAGCGRLLHTHSERERTSSSSD